MLSSEVKQGVNKESTNDSFSNRKDSRDRLGSSFYQSEDGSVSTRQRLRTRIDYSEANNKKTFDLSNDQDMEADIDILYKVLCEVKFIKDMEKEVSKELIRKLLRNIESEKVDKRKVIFNQGDQGSKFYIILRGAVWILVPNNFSSGITAEQVRQGKEIQRDEDAISKLTDSQFLQKAYPIFNCIAILKDGFSFGEIALRQQTVRTATVVAQEQCFMVSVTRQIFNSCISEYYKTLRDSEIQFLQTFQLFKELYKQDVEMILMSCVKQTFNRNHIIYKENDLSEDIYFLKEGEVQISILADIYTEDPNLLFLNRTLDLKKEKLPVRTINHGEKKLFKRVPAALIVADSLFGAEEAFNNKKRETQAIVVSTTCTFFSLNIKDFHHIMNKRFHCEYVEELKQKTLLKKITHRQEKLSKDLIVSQQYVSFEDNLIKESKISQKQLKNKLTSSGKIRQEFLKQHEAEEYVIQQMNKDIYTAGASSPIQLDFLQNLNIGLPETILAKKYHENEVKLRSESQQFLKIDNRSTSKDSILNNKNGHFDSASLHRGSLRNSSQEKLGQLISKMTAPRVNSPEIFKEFQNTDLNFFRDESTSKQSPFKTIVSRFGKKLSRYERMSTESPQKLSLTATVSFESPEKLKPKRLMSAQPSHRNNINNNSSTISRPTSAAFSKETDTILNSDELSNSQKNLILLSMQKQRKMLSSSQDFSKIPPNTEILTLKPNKQYSSVYEINTSPIPKRYKEIDLNNSMTRLSFIDQSFINLSQTQNFTRTSQFQSEKKVKYYETISKNSPQKTTQFQFQTPTSRKSARIASSDHFEKPLLNDKSEDDELEEQLLMRLAIQDIMQKGKKVNQIDEKHPLIDFSYLKKYEKEQRLQERQLNKQARELEQSRKKNKQPSFITARSSKQNNYSVGESSFDTMNQTYRGFDLQKSKNNQEGLISQDCQIQVIGGNFQQNNSKKTEQMRNILSQGRRVPIKGIQGQSQILQQKNQYSHKSPLPSTDNPSMPLKNGQENNNRSKSSQSRDSKCQFNLSVVRNAQNMEEFKRNIRIHLGKG